MNRTSLVSILFTATLLATTAFAAQLDKIQFIKISPQDSKAVIRGTDGKMQVIKPGDTVVENVTVKEIIPGRIILEEKTEKGLETIIVRVDGVKTRIERLSRQPEKTPLMMAPVSAIPVSK
ncbi:MAG: hypothetical protein HY888_13235 [Deltaproteobacteria bacterium]|nr:hypothetical protein [Deltaproteobacteria bacterium]